MYHHRRATRRAHRERRPSDRRVPQPRNMAATIGDETLCTARAFILREAPLDAMTTPEGLAPKAFDLSTAHYNGSGMAAGDAQRVWFPEMVERLQSLPQFGIADAQRVNALEKRLGDAPAAAHSIFTANVRKHTRNPRVASIAIGLRSEGGGIQDVPGHSTVGACFRTSRCSGRRAAHSIDAAKMSDGSKVQVPRAVMCMFWLG